MMSYRKLFLTCMIIFIAGFTKINAQEIERDYITASADTIMVVPADICYITLHIVCNGVLVEDATRKADKIEQDIFSNLKEKFNSIEDITIIQEYIKQKKDNVWSTTEKETTPSPQVVRKFRITLKPDKKIIQKIIDYSIRHEVLLDAPSSVVTSQIMSNVTYGLLNHEELEIAGFKAMVEKLNKIASKLANSINKEIDYLVRIEPSLGNFYNLYQPIEGARFPVKYYSDVSDKIKVSVLVQALFKMNDKTK